MPLGSLVFGGAPIGGLYAPVSDEAATAPGCADGADQFYGSPALSRVRDYSGGRR